jgi:Protein of unknown function (DUF2844)
MKRRLLALLCLMVATSARASLGGTADSVETDRRALSANRLPTAARTGYLVHEVEVGGTRVREYLSPAGVVFGVAWDGLAQPDLDTLLGPYAATWREADRLAPRSPGRRSRTVSAPHLVVEKWGHMRHLQGRAYDPDLLPPGLKADEIR